MAIVVQYWEKLDKTQLQMAIVRQYCIKFGKLKLGITIVPQFFRRCVHYNQDSPDHRNSPAGLSLAALLLGLAHFYIFSKA